MGCNNSKITKTNEKLIDITNYNRNELNNEIILNVEAKLRDVLNDELNSVTIINEFKGVTNNNDILEDLKNSINDNDISYEGLCNLPAKVIDVYDANICTIKFIHNNTIFQTIIKMDGYSAPEKTTSKNNAKILEKRLSIKTTDKFTQLCCSPGLNKNEKIVKLDIVKYDKNGKKNAKNVGRIYTEENGCINDYMIRNKYAYVCENGEKKKIQELLVEGYYSHLLITMSNSVIDLLDFENIDVNSIDDCE